VRLKLKCDDLLSNIGFKFNLRRYTLVPSLAHAPLVGPCRLTVSTLALKVRLVSARETKM